MQYVSVVTNIAFFPASSFVSYVTQMQAQGSAQALDCTLYVMSLVWFQNESRHTSARVMSRFFFFCNAHLIYIYTYIYVK